MINVVDLTFSHEGSYDNIFENASFQLDTNWKLGLTGRNGRGKTTLLELFMGKYPYSGKISADVEFEYFPYPVDVDSRIAIDTMQSVCPTAEDWEMIRETSLLDVDTESLYKPFNMLSEGERTKILLAALFLGSERFLLIDEPTNHLDSGARLKVGEYLRRKKGFILVSHDRKLLDMCVDHIMSINRCSIEIQQGNFSIWLENKKRQDNAELEQNERLKKEIGRISEAAKRTAAWSEKAERSKAGAFDKGFAGHKAAKIMKRAKNQENRMQAAIDEKSGLLKDIDWADSLKISPLIYRSRILVNAHNLSVYYGEQQLFDNISFQIQQGERVAVTGKNGCGKSTLLKLICGKNIKSSGVLDIGSNLKISYVSQDTSSLSGTLSDYAKNRGIDESLFKTILRKLGFERIQFEKTMQYFSGGQKKKVLLAASLSESAHLYVWDEPLNFIDVISRIQIEELIIQSCPTLLFVEHDIAFQESIATSFVRL